MPLLSKLLSQRVTLASNDIDVRYCNDDSRRHRIAGGIKCSFAAPEITELVPKDKQLKLRKQGGEARHFTFDTIQDASLLQRLSKRFESIDTDRQEQVVDILNEISNQSRDSLNVLKSVCKQISFEGTVCSLLQKICDAFNESCVVETPQLDEVLGNTAQLVDRSTDTVLEIRCLRKNIVSVGQTVKASVDRITDRTSGLIDKCCAETCALKNESKAISESIRRLEESKRMNVSDLRQELSELRHQFIQMKEEIASLRIFWTIMNTNS